MPLYMCQICNFSTKLKSNYTQHLNTKHAHNLNLQNEKENKDDNIIRIPQNVLNFPQISSIWPKVPQKMSKIDLLVSSKSEEKCQKTIKANELQFVCEYLLSTPMII